MKRFLLIYIGIIIFSNVQGQSVNDLINETNLDSLVKTVRDLSGEDSTYVNDSLVLIQHRTSWLDNNIAADYIMEKLISYDLSVTDQVYSLEGRNIFATQPGNKNPDNIYIVCAHYDCLSWDNPNIAPGADDDASGVAAVLEAARILSAHCFENTIIYALWDQEEEGLHGSAYYGSVAYSNGENILGVINIEMLGYDSDDDMVFDIHTREIANSIQLKDLLIDIVNNNELRLVPNVFNPGTTAGDHSTFWALNIGAICYSESFFGIDPNPWYHTSDDRILYFNLPYFHELSKLGVGTIASLAVPMVSISESSIISKIRLFPNPSPRSFNIDFGEFYSDGLIEITNLVGKLVYSNKISKTNLHKITLNEPTGLYIVTISTNDEVVNLRLIIN